MTDHNTMARRVTVANALVSLIPDEHAAVKAADDMHGSDMARYARLSRQMGEVADTMLYGGAPLEDTLLHVAASAMAWIDQLLKEQTR